MFSNRSQMIHVISEVVVLIGFTFYFSSKINKVTAELTNMIEIVKAQNNKITSLENIITNLSQKVSTISLNVHKSLPAKPYVTFSKNPVSEIPKQMLHIPEKEETSSKSDIIEVNFQMSDSEKQDNNQKTLSETTDLPVETTDLPVETTDSPVETTDSPVETTDLSVETTENTEEELDALLSEELEELRQEEEKLE